MDPLALLAIILFLAFLVETLVEATFAPIMDNFTVLLKYKWMLMYIAMGVGIAGAFLYKLDIVYLLGAWLNVVGEGWKMSAFGIVLTGLAIGKGSNYLHELIKKFLTPKPG